MRRELNTPLLDRPGSGLRQPFLYDAAADEVPAGGLVVAPEPLMRSMQRAGATTGLLARVDLLASTQLPVLGDGGDHLDQLSCISPDGRVAYVAAYHGTAAFVFELDTGAVLRLFSYSADGAEVTRLSLSSSGGLLAVGFRYAQNDDILLFDTASGEERLRLRASAVSALCFTPDGRTLLCSHVMDRALAAFELSSATSQVFGSTHFISSACVLPAGALPGVRVAAFSMFGSGAVTIYDASGQTLLTAPIRNGLLFASSASPKGGLLAVSSVKLQPPYTRLFDTSRSHAMALAPMQLQQARAPYPLPPLLPA